MKTSLTKSLLSTLVPIGLLAGLWLVFVVPHPSLRRTAMLRNASTNNVRVECATLDRKHRLQVRLAPGEILEFVYFVGDRGGVEGDSISAQILVTNLGTGQQAERTLRLSIGPSRPLIQISDDWFVR